MILLNRRVGVLISFLIFCVSATSQTKLYILRYPSKSAINSVNAAPPISHLQNADLLRNYLPNAASLNKYLQNRDPFKNYLQNAAPPNRYIQNADPSKKYLTNAASPNRYLQNADPSNQYLLNAASPNRYLGNGVSNRLGLSDRQILLLLLNSVIKQQNQKVEETRSECLRLFGSMHGTKDEKIRCLENLKKSKLERDKLEATLPNKNSRTKGPLIDKRPFVDYTRIAEDYFGFDKLKRTDFSTDYIYFDDLRFEKPDDDHLKTDTDVSGTKNNPEFKDFREFSRRRKKHRKNNENDLRQRSLYSSDDDSEISIEVSKKNHVRMFKPKRFQVIRNVKPSSSNENEKSSKTKHYDYSFESKPRKTKRKVKKVQTSSEESIKSSKNKKEETDFSSDESDSQAKNSHNKDFSESESSSEVVTKKPSKSKTKHKKVAKSSSEKYPKPSQKKHKKETYLQGHRVVDLRRDATNRLEHFMPKRFYWDDEEFKHLGYYWFNGPQGNFPFHRIRS